MLGGFIVRLGVLFAIVLALDPCRSSTSPCSLLTIAVIHLALLMWETRHVSLTLGFPGLKPGRQ